MEKIKYKIRIEIFASNYIYNVGSIIIGLHGKLVKLKILFDKFLDKIKYLKILQQSKKAREKR